MNFVLGSDSDENRSRSPSPHEVAPTPGFSLEHHDSRQVEEIRWSD
jgi:hypothetical protein